MNSINCDFQLNTFSIIFHGINRLIFSHKEEKKIPKVAIQFKKKKKEFLNNIFADIVEK